MSRIEIFRAGVRTPMRGPAIAFSEADLAASAAAYDPARHEAPIVVGHPVHDAPAYGWIATLAAEGPSLYAEPRQVEAAFAEMVEAGRFKKVSATFYLPEAPGNPVPGVYYLKHVGFLGAQAPAVKGLKAVAFSEADADQVATVEFGEPPRSWVIRTIGELFRGLRDHLIAEKGVEAADAVAPGWRIDSVIEEATRMEEASAPGPARFSEPAPTREDTATVTTRPGAGNPSAEELQQREQRLQQQEAAFAERERARRRRETEASVDALIAQARLPAAQRPAVLAFAERLDADAVVEFGEGDGKASRTMRDQFLALLAGLPPAVSFGERAAPEGAAGVAEFAAPPGFTVDPVQLDLHRKALAFQAANPGTDYVTAVRAIERK